MCGKTQGDSGQHDGVIENSLLRCMHRGIDGHSLAKCRVLVRIAGNNCQTFGFTLC